MRVPKPLSPRSMGRGNAGELAQPCAAAYAVQPLAKQGGILERLPKGFDQRSREAFRAAARAQTASRCVPSMHERVQRNYAYVYKAWTTAPTGRG